jgi:hypothetical protein
LSSNTVWDVRVGRFVYTRKDDPSTGDVTTPGRFDRVMGVFSGAPQDVWGWTLIRTPDAHSYASKGTINHIERVIRPVRYYVDQRNYDLIRPEVPVDKITVWSGDAPPWIAAIPLSKLNDF